VDLPLLPEHGLQRLLGRHSDQTLEHGAAEEVESRIVVSRDRRQRWIARHLQAIEIELSLQLVLESTPSCTSSCNARDKSRALLM
jgi:hypothetical protein